LHNIAGNLYRAGHSAIALPEAPMLISGHKVDRMPDCD
jgi:hypothetical protein